MFGGGRSYAGLVSSVVALSIVACGGDPDGETTTVVETQAPPAAEGESVPESGSQQANGGAGQGDGRADAIAAARKAAGGGRLVEIERDDGGWEVELRKGGRKVEVKLDGGLRVLEIERDDDDGDD